MDRKFDLAKCQASILERSQRIEQRLKRLELARKPLIFLGPSLPLERALSLLDADYWPPIARNDLIRALEEGYRVFGIIDGVFHQNLSVSIEEIRHAMEMGATVYGASSMGALRAAEAYPLGMQGVGVVYQWYRDETIDCDDEVAVSFDEATGRSLTEPSVNLRATLERLETKGDLNSQEAAWIIERYLQLHFTRRNIENLFSSLASSFPPELTAKWRKMLESEWVNQKSLDAIQLINLIGQKHATGIT